MTTLTQTGCATINTKELAKMLSVSVRHIERQDSAGRIPRPIRIGRSKRWRTDEITAWLEAGCPDRVTWESMNGGRK